MRAFHALSEEIIAAASPAEIAEKLLRVLPAITQATTVRVYLFNRRTKSLERLPTAADPDLFCWKDPPYEYEHQKMPIDCLAGSSQLREQIDGGMSARDIARSWESAVSAFLKIRERFLMY